MNSRLPTLVAAALLAASCSPKQAEPAPAAPVPPPATAPAPTPPAEAAPIPQPTPAQEAPVTPPSEASPEAAAEVAREYFALLGARQYGPAWDLWTGGSGVGKSEFAGRYAKYASYNATVGKAGQMEGAAGSSYIEFPVKVDATLKSGGAEHLAGTVTLRRVNDVPGSTDAQRHWHIQGVDLKPAS